MTVRGRAVCIAVCAALITTPVFAVSGKTSRIDGYAPSSVGALPCGNHIIGDIVHCMDSAGAGVQHDVVAVQLILMYHSSVLLVQKKCRLNRRQLFENCD